MNSEELRLTINKHLFVPMEESLAERLHDVTEFIVEGVDAHIAEDYLKAFFANSVNVSFRSLFKTKYNEMYDEDIQLPTIVFLVLEIYFIRQTLHSKFIDEHLKRHISYSVKNFAVLKKGNWNDLICTDWIIEIYRYSKSNTYAFINDCMDSNQLINNVLSSDSWIETGLDIHDQDIYNQLRSLCAEGIRVRINSYVNDPLFLRKRSPFAQVYLLVRKMVFEWNWKYIAVNPIRALREFLGENSLKKKNLCNIVNEIKTSVLESDIVIPVKESSVLLRRIQTNKTCKIERCMFSALEFGSYLYYEMLLESFNN